jgi:hypothetical protein
VDALELQLYPDTTPMTTNNPTRTLANVLLLVSAIMLLVGTLTTVGNALGGRPLLWSLGGLLSGLVLLALAALLLRDAAVAFEVLLSTVSLPLLLLGIGVLLRSLQGKGGSAALAGALLAAGAVGLYSARRLIRQRLQRGARR